MSRGQPESPGPLRGERVRRLLDARLNSMVSSIPLTALNLARHTMIGCDRLWSNGGRPAPFLQARAIMDSNPTITPDPRGPLATSDIKELAWK